MRALILAILAWMSPGAQHVADARVVDAIVEASMGATREEVALLTVYAWLESGAQVDPKPYSWDARAHVSCGPWQEPCAIVARLTLGGQARYWVRQLREVGLAKVDSSPSRAAKRLQRARDALEGVRQ